MKKRVALQRGLIALAVAAGIYWGQVLVFRSVTEPWEEILDAVGLVMVLLGFCARIVSRGYKEMGSDNGSRLVTGGLYAYVRNPMYLGTFLIGMGVTFAVFHPVAIMIFLTGYMAIYIPQIMREERILTGHFGEEYRNYCQTVPRLIPAPVKWGEFFSELFPRSGKAIWRESQSVILVLVGMVVVQTAVEARSWTSPELWEEPLEFLGAIVVFLILLYFFAKEEK